MHIRTTARLGNLWAVVSTRNCAVFCLRQTLETPETDEVCLMREQLHRINGFLADQAIYLSLTNDKLKALALRMANKGYSYWSEHGRRRVDTKVLNFSQVSLRRIFAKGRLDRGAASTRVGGRPSRNNSGATSPLTGSLHWR